MSKNSIYVYLIFILYYWIPTIIITIPMFMSYFRPRIEGEVGERRFALFIGLSLFNKIDIYFYPSWLGIIMILTGLLFLSIGYKVLLCCKFH